MSVEQRIDDLITAGWHVLDSDFDATAFRQWRKRAVDCLNSLFGPDHTYTQQFRDYVNREERKSILTGGGILSAARETVGENGLTHESTFSLTIPRNGNRERTN